MGRMEPKWGYDATGEWVMLNRAEFEAWKAADVLRALERDRESRKRQRGWLWTPTVRFTSTGPPPNATWNGEDVYVPAITESGACPASLRGDKA